MLQQLQLFYKKYFMAKKYVTRGVALTPYLDKKIKAIAKFEKRSYSSALRSLLITLFKK